MPTILSHMAVPVALGVAAGSRAVSARLLAAGMAASVLPDLDVISFRLGVHYGHELGHRGISHSLAFACALGLVAAAFAPILKTSRLRAFLLVALAAASHGLLDMFTNGGRGVAIFWPLTSQRYFFPWQFIEVSPISIARFFSERGAMVLLSEFLWVWLPCLALALLFRIGSRRKSPVEPIPNPAPYDARMRQ